jgi:hypothetical protein
MQRHAVVPSMGWAHAVPFCMTAIGGVFALRPRLASPCKTIRHTHFLPSRRLHAVAPCQACHACARRLPNLA